MGMNKLKSALLLNQSQDYFVPPISTELCGMPTEWNLNILDNIITRYLQVSEA